MSNDNQGNLRIVPIIDKPDAKTGCAALLTKIRDWLTSAMSFRVSFEGSSPGLTTVWTGPEEPPSEQRGVPWIKTDAQGRYLGTFIYYQGQYVSDGSPASLPAGCALALSPCDCLSDESCACPSEPSPWTKVDDFIVDADDAKIKVDTSELKAQINETVEVEISVGAIADRLQFVDGQGNPMSPTHVDANGDVTTLFLQPSVAGDTIRVPLTLEFEAEITPDSIEGQICNIAEEGETADYGIKLTGRGGQPICLSEYTGFDFPLGRS